MNSLANSVSECQKINLNNRLTQSYEKFLQRLKTFELFKWFGKPPEFSPIECARRGWINISRDTLKCVSCSNIFYHYSQSPLTISKHQSSLSDENFKKTVFTHDPKELAEKHNKNCPWRTLSLSDKLIQVDIYAEDHIYETFLKRIDSYKKCDKLPVLVDTISQSFNEQSDHSSDLVPINDSLNKQKYKINRNAFIMACCGWTFNANMGIVSCEKCLRTVGLWLYKTERNLFDDKKLKHKQEQERPHELLAQLSTIETNESSANYLSETQPYSNELVIENLMKNMVKCIEVNVQADLRQQGMAESQDPSESKKRRLTDEEGSASIAKKMCMPQIDDTTAAVLSSRRAIDSHSNNEKKTTSKLFDPLSEHFNYCPWLKTEHDNFSDKRNVCQLHYDIIKRYLIKLDREDQEVRANQRKTVASSAQEPPLIQLDDSLLRAKQRTTASLTSEEITSRIKSVHSLLINCASQCSFSQMNSKS